MQVFHSLMKPYYQDSMVALFHGNALDFVGDMDRFDLLLSDPPYGLPGEDIETVMTVLRRAKFDRAAIFADWRNSHRFGALPNKIGELAWEYGWISGGRTKARYGVPPTHNTIHLFGDVECFQFLEGSIIPRQPGFSSPRQCSFATKTGHPFEKPLKLMEWLLTRIECHDVFDPFAGSGTTLLAAKSLGKQCVGVEIEERWCEIIAKRLSQEVLDLGGAA